MQRRTRITIRAMKAIASRSIVSPALRRTPWMANMTVKQGKITEEMIRVLSAWKHSWFHVFCGNRISPSDDKAMENLVRYIIRALFSQERIQYLDQEGKVIYTAKNKKNKQGFPRRRIKYGVGSGMIGRYVNSLGYVFTSPGKGNSYQTLRTPCRYLKRHISMLSPAAGLVLLSFEHLQRPDDRRPGFPGLDHLFDERMSCRLIRCRKRLNIFGHFLL